MKVDEFEIQIPEGLETPDGYVGLAHATPYTLRLTNHSRSRCDAAVEIDGKHVGIWRVDNQTSVCVERPLNDRGRFTFFLLGTVEALVSRLPDNEDLGLVSVEFRRELPVNVVPDRDRESYCLNASRVTAEGGTGLSGHSNQEFTYLPDFKYDRSRVITIHLRLITRDALCPRDLRSNPVPPRLRVDDLRSAH